MFKNIHQSYFVIIFALGVIAGTIVALIFKIRFFCSPVWSILVGIILVFVYFKPKLLFLVLVFVSGVILAFLRISAELSGAEYAKELYGKAVVLEGVVYDDPESDDGGTKYRLRELCFGEKCEMKLKGSIYVSGYKNLELERGDKIFLEGKFSEGFGIYVGYIYKPTILKIEKPSPGSFILKIRNWFSERIKKLIKGPQSNLGLSYLLGMKSGLPDELAENLRVVGLVHIVVASGAHLSILVSVAKKIFGKLSRFSGLLFSLLFIIFFMAMVGFTPSILRAGIMSILTLITWYVGRKIPPIKMILMVAMITLLIDPMFIVNLGWLLSFASFSGIMILAPEMKKFFYGDKEIGFIAEVVITTLSATIMTLPITLYYYGQVSLISVIANLIILPTLSYAMGLVFLTGVFFDIGFIGSVMGFLAEKLLEFHINVVNFFAGMKQFLIEIPIQQPGVFLIYGVILLVIFGIYLRKRRPR